MSKSRDPEGQHDADCWAAWDAGNWGEAIKTKREVIEAMRITALKLSKDTRRLRACMD